MKEDEAARESKSDKVKDEFDKVKDDLLLWIKEAPVLKFRNLKPDEFKKDLASTWNIFVDNRTSATMFQVDGPNFMSGLCHGKYLFARICDGFAGKPLGKDVQHRQNLCEWFHRPNATLKLNPFHNLPSLYLHFGSWAKTNAEHSLSCEFLCMSIDKNSQLSEVTLTTDSVSVTDGFSQKGYYIEKRTKSTLKKERRRNLRNKISMAGVTYKRMKDVHPLSLVYDIQTTDKHTTGWRICNCFFILFALFFSLFNAIDINNGVEIIDLEQHGGNFIIRTTKCRVNIYSIPKAKRAWPSIFQHNYNASFRQHRYMLATQVGNQVTLGGGKSLEFGSAAVTSNILSNNTNYINISGKKNGIFYGTCNLNIYMDTDDTTQNNLNITLIGDSYTKEKPLVIRSTNYPQFKTIFNALNIKADYIDARFNELVVSSNLNITAFSGSVVTTGFYLRKNANANVKIGYKIDTNTVCVPRIQPAFGNSSTLSQRNSSLSLLNSADINGQNQSEGVIDECYGSGGDVKFVLRTSTYIVAKERSEAICLTGKNIESVSAKNATREAIMCVDAGECGILPTLHVETVEGGVYIHMQDQSTNISSYKKLEGVESTPFINTRRRLDIRGDRLLRDVGSWLQATPYEDHALWIPTLVNGKYYSFWWFSRRIYAELWIYWFDIFSFRFLRPKFGAREIRVIPGFCDVNLEVTEVSESNPKSGIGRLDKVYGGAISELIASRFSNEVNGPVIQSTNIDWKKHQIHKLGDFFDLFQGMTVAYLRDSSGSYKEERISITENPVLILALVVSLVFSAFCGGLVAVAVYHASGLVTKYLKEYFITKIKTGRELIRSATENGDGENAFGDDKLYFYSNVRENEIRNFSLSLFQYFEYKFLMLDSVWYGDSLMSYLEDGEDFTVVHDQPDFYSDRHLDSSDSSGNADNSNASKWFDCFRKTGAKKGNAYSTTVKQVPTTTVCTRK